MIDHISPSQLGTWRRCPKQWEYRYIEGIKSPPSGSLVLGGAYHKALEASFRHKLEHEEDAPIELAHDTFSQEWEKVVTGRVMEDQHREVEVESIEWEGKDPGVIKDMGHGMVGAYMLGTAPSVWPLEVEKWVDVVIADIPFRMRVDLITQDLIIVDHKTAGRKKSQADMDRELQPAAYMLGLRTLVPFEFHVALKYKNPTVQIVRVAKSPRDLVWFVEMAKTTFKAMNSGICPPNDTGWWCSEKYCGYHAMCKG